MDRKQLYDQMRQSLNESELRDVCFYMDVDYESIAVHAKHTLYDKMRELIQAGERLGKLTALLQACERVRPEREWFSETLIQSVVDIEPAKPPTSTPQTELFTELLTPMMIQLQRTRDAMSRWTGKNLFLESEIVRKGNQAVRDLLINKAPLIPPDLMPDAHALIAHYDRWLEKYERMRGGDTPDLNTPFVFTGPDGSPFPIKAEQHFLERYETLKSKVT